MTNTLEKSKLVVETRLGIDFGGVIVPMTKWKRRCGTPVSRVDFFGSPGYPGALEKIRDLVRIFNGNVWIVSKAGIKVENMTRNWLDKHDFFCIHRYAC